MDINAIFRSPPPLSDDLSLRPSDELSTVDKEKLVDSLLTYLTFRDKTEKMSAAELANAVISKVLGPMKLGTEAEAVFSELLARFEKMNGIERDEDGEIIGGGWKS